MNITDVHRGLISKAKKLILETGDFNIKDLGMDTRDFYVHFPGGVSQLKEYMNTIDKQK